MLPFKVLIAILTYQIIILFPKFVNSKNVGDPCTDQISQRKGICRLSNDCPGLEEKLQKGQTPRICDFQHFIVPIFCCVSEEENSQFAATNTQQFNLPVDNLPPRKITAEEKCNQYSQLVQKCDFNNNHLIVGGKAVVTGEIPFMVSIGYEDGNFNCGGSLISENFVLTAAHCIRTRSGRPSKVRMGHLNLSGEGDSTKIDVEVSEIFTHQKYKPPKKYNDIALLKLKNSVSFNDNVRPGCLWTQFEIRQEQGIAAGWGATSVIEGGRSETLQKVSLSIFHNNFSKCQEVYPVSSRLPFGIAETMLCAGELGGGKDTCQGDSGGALFIYKRNNNCIQYIVGITSFSRSCGVVETPAIYTRVSEYVDWIEEIVWNK